MVCPPGKVIIKSNFSKIQILISFLCVRAQVDLSSPMMQTREYTSLAIGDCPIERLKSFQVTTTDSASCRDTWKASVLFSDLLANCGFKKYDQVTINATLYEVWGRPSVEVFLVSSLCNLFLAGVEKV